MSRGLGDKRETRTARGARAAYGLVCEQAPQRRTLDRAMDHGQGDPVSALATLADKYRRMAALRHSLGDAPPNAAARAELRALAAEWPGALRELDTLSTAELDH